MQTSCRHTCSPQAFTQLQRSTCPRQLRAPIWRATRSPEMSEYMVFALLGFGLGRRPGAARHRILLGFRGSGDVNFSQGAAAMFPAGDALAAGLVDQVVAAGDLLPAARHRTRELVTHSSPVSAPPPPRL